MLAEYTEDNWKGSTMERTPSKTEQNDLMNSGGLNLSMAGHPRTYSPILYSQFSIP